MPPPPDTRELIPQRILYEILYKLLFSPLSDHRRFWVNWIEHRFGIFPTTKGLTALLAQLMEAPLTLCVKGKRAPFLLGQGKNGQGDLDQAFWEVDRQQESHLKDD